MEKSGLLTALIPELSPLKGVEQPKEHHWDVFEHSIKTVSTVDFILHQGVWDYQDKAVSSKGAVDISDGGIFRPAGEQRQHQKVAGEISRAAA